MDIEAEEDRAMTREDIKEQTVKLIEESTYQTELKLLAFIDELIDELESSTCPHCGNQITLPKDKNTTRTTMYEDKQPQYTGGRYEP